jgi:hypothetical protein
MWYRIDHQNVLREVSSDWDDFAVETRSSDACQYRVINRPLLGFVSDIATRSFLNALFFNVRETASPIALSYRCDGPDIRRLFEMIIEPTSENGLMVRHEPVAITQDSSVLRIPSPKATCQCTQCLRYHVSGDWIEGILTDPGPGTLIPRRICFDCRKAAMDAISGSQTVRALAG